MIAMLKKGDYLILSLLFLLSCVPAAWLHFTEGSLPKGTCAVISIDGQLYKTVPLETHTGTDYIDLNNQYGFNRIEITDQRIRIIDADCPDLLCVQEGFIKNPGELIVCLPHRLLIEIKNTEGAQADIIPAR